MPQIHKIDSPVFREKMAAFDYDWTMVSPKNGKTFPSNIDDWVWLYSNVPTKIKQYYDDGYMIVIFTNQSKPWKCEQIQMVAKELHVPVFIAIATDKNEYKPNLIMFNEIVGDNIINKGHSFFVGDALGRKGDFDNTDKLFAENIGIKCLSPEEMFSDTISLPTITLPNIPLLDEPEIIIMVGYPGSGKSTLANEICKNNKYVRIEGDLYKTSAKMIKKASEYIPQYRSIIFDATNSSIKKRKEYITFGEKYNYKIKCIHVSTPSDIAFKRNKTRDEDKQVPKIAYSVYTKHYEEPNENEGFTLITV